MYNNQDKAIKKVENIVDRFLREHHLSSQYRDDLIQECWLARLEARNSEEAMKLWIKKFKR